jgi:hypothetical protein
MIKFKYLSNITSYKRYIKTKNVVYFKIKNFNQFKLILRKGYTIFTLKIQFNHKICHFPSKF